MDAAKNVTANFNTGGSPQYALTANKAGAGQGTIASSPTGIDCGSLCTKSFNANTQVTLTATPSATSTFTGWSGACTGTTTCVVTMSAAKSVTANFDTTQQTCTSVTLDKTSLTFDAEDVSSGQYIKGTAFPAGCSNPNYWVNQIVNNNSWIRTGCQFSPCGTGLEVHADHYTGTTVRTGTFTVAGHTITVTQNPPAPMGIPLPTSVYDFPFTAEANPVISAVPAQAKPIGLGAAANGGSTINVTIGANFATNASFDAYFVIVIPNDPNLYFYNGTNWVASTSLIKWKSGFNGSLNVNLFNNVDLIKGVPNGTYTFYFGVSPAGDISKYYLWHTKFTNTKYGTTPPIISSLTCTDTDGGRNYFVMGTVTQYRSDAYLNSLSDKCVKNNNNGTYSSGEPCYNTVCDTVEEIYCIADGNWANENVPCAKGCLNGACIQ